MQLFISLQFRLEFARITITGETANVYTEIEQED